MKFVFSLLLFAVAVQSEAQTFSRAGMREYSLQPFVLGTKSYDFGVGASARTDSGIGIGLGFTQHLNDYLAVGVEFTLSEMEYRARVAPGAGNAAAAFDAEDVLERGTVKLHATWHFLRGPLTPFVTGAAGVTYMDPGADIVPPGPGCWVYPWWGQFCGERPPSHNFTRFTYGAGAGMRWDMGGNRGFLRLLASSEWIDWPDQPPGTLRTYELRADFGARF